jgi:HlyD family secretion protein
VQHREGGVVGEIFVKEGQRVERGQVLIRLAAAEVRAQERALTSQVIGLLAQRARLRAEQLGGGGFAPPPEFASLQGSDRAEAATALRIQRAQLQTRRSLLSAQKSAFANRTAQLAQESRGYGSQLSSATEQERLIDEELEGIKEVVDKGFVSKNRQRALERAKADLQGRRGQFGATIAQTGEAAGEARLKIIETERGYQEKVAAELKEVEFALNDAQPRLNAARDQLARTEIRAPASGIVVGLTVFTEGGVIAPGQKLMDIVPDNAALLIEARVNPDDADDLVVGQETQVRFDSLHERSLPTLKGELTRLSADAFVDERTGESFFTAEVTVPHDQLQLIYERRGKDFALRAGMPVQVLVPLRKRTALQYAFEPLTGSMWKSFREQ